MLVRERDSNQSHLRMSYRPMVDVDNPKQRAALMVYGTLLGGSMGSRLFDEIREQRGLAYSVSAFPHAYADVPILQLSAGLESSKCMEAYRRMRDIVSELRTDGPTEAEVERAQAYAAGARTIAFENTGAVARYAAQQTIVYGEDADPDVTIELLDKVTFDEVREVAAGVADGLSVAVRRAAHRGGAGDGLRRLARPRAGVDSLGGRDRVGGARLVEPHEQTRRAVRRRLRHRRPGQEEGSHPPAPPTTRRC